MVINNKVSNTFYYVSLLAFILFAIVLLFVNQEVFYTIHGYSEFLPSTTSFGTLLSRPFGLIQYIGSALTHLFYYPALGTSVLVVIWSLIFFVGKKAFRLQSNTTSLMLLPVACLLTSVVDLGYWVYVMDIRGYFFSQSVGYILMLLLLWVAISTPRKWHLAFYLLGFCLYPVLGWFAILFVLCLIFSKKPSWFEIFGCVIILFTARIWRTILYSQLNIDNVLLGGFPYFDTASNTSDYLSIPFIVLGAISVLILLCSRYLNKWFVPVLSSVAAIVFTTSFMYNDSNYIDEMRIVRSADEDNWNDVLNIVENNPKPTTTMLMLKNVALMNEGGLLDRSFKTGNIASPIYNPDSLRVSFLQIAAPVVYYNYGMLNEGFRLGFECAMQTGFSPAYLKILARCAKANGEDNLANRYINLLHDLPFYGDWQPAPVSKKVVELHGAYPDEICGVENSDGYLVTSMSLWYSTKSRLASEQALFYSMISKNSVCFWRSLRKYINLHMNEEFPTHAQEAYIIFLDREPEEKRMMLPVSEDIYGQYKQFWASLEKLMNDNVDKSEIPEIMRRDFGDTYWYYYIFNTKKY